MAPVSGSRELHTSPSGDYSLEITEYTSGPESWNYSRGRVQEVASGSLIADVKRNLAGFWFAWVLREDGEYLLCGEDYQGYNVIDLRRGRNVLTFPPEAFKGQGFCWGTARPSPHGRVLAVEGCYWGGPNELVFYDFTEPLRSPLPEIARIDEILRAESWLDDGHFAYVVEEGSSTRQVIWERSDGEASYLPPTSSTTSKNADVEQAGRDDAGEA